MPSRKWIRRSLVVLAVMVGYSILPLFRLYMLTGPACLSDNNDANARKLEENEGVYFSFIVWGDNHAGLPFNDGCAMKQIWHMNREDRFRKTPIDLVLSTGDITVDGARWQFDVYKKLQELIKYPVIVAVGNHDTGLFREYCGSKDLSFANRNSYFIVLDNAIGSLTREQFEWFVSELEKGRSYENIFVAMHKPPYDPIQQDPYSQDNSPWAYRFRKLCAEYGVRAVFAGHKHVYDHSVFDGVDYITTGGGGMLIEAHRRDGGFLHYVMVNVNHDYVTWEVREVGAPLWAHLMYYLWKEAVYWVRDFYGSGYIFGVNRTHRPLIQQRLNDPDYWRENYERIGFEYDR